MDHGTSVHRFLISPNHLCSLVTVQPVRCLVENRERSSKRATEKPPHDNPHGTHTLTHVVRRCGGASNCWSGDRVRPRLRLSVVSCSWIRPLSSSRLHLSRIVVRRCGLLLKALPVSFARG